VTTRVSGVNGKSSRQVSRTARFFRPAAARSARSRANLCFLLEHVSGVGSAGGRDVTAPLTGRAEHSFLCPNQYPAASEVARVETRLRCRLSQRHMRCLATSCAKPRATMSAKTNEQLSGHRRVSGSMCSALFFGQDPQRWQERRGCVGRFRDYWHRPATPKPKSCSGLRFEDVPQATVGGREHRNNKLTQLSTRGF
jgi:hypothetical protein